MGALKAEVPTASHAAAHPDASDVTTLDRRSTNTGPREHRRRGVPLTVSGEQRPVEADIELIAEATAQEQHQHRGR